MLKLSSNSVVPLSQVSDISGIFRLTEQADCPPVLRSRELFLVRNPQQAISPGFAAYLFFERPAASHLPNTFLLEPDLSYLSEGDIIRLNTKRTSLRTLYR